MRHALAEVMVDDFSASFFALLWSVINALLWSFSDAGLGVVEFGVSADSGEVIIFFFEALILIVGDNPKVTPGVKRQCLVVETVLKDFVSSI